MAGLSPKQERFARAYVECGSGAEAYRRAYNVGETTKQKTVWEAASRVLAKSNVAARVIELQEEARKRTMVTVESLTAELDEARQIAKDEEDAAELRQNTMAKAKLHGLDVHKVEAKGVFNVVISGDDADL